MAGEPTSATELHALGHDERHAALLSAELAELVEWEAEQRRRDVRRAELLAAVHASRVCDTDHGQRTHAWLADACGLPEGTARHLVRTATRLHVLYPALASALADGRVGWQHVSAFDRVANSRNRDALVELIDDLVDLAQVTTFTRWHQELRGIAERLDADGGYDPARDPANNQLHLTPTLDGVTHVSGRLVGELALVVRSLVNAEAERVMARHRADAEATGQPDELPSAAQVRAEALAELLERGAAAPDDTGSMPHPEIVVVYEADTDTLADAEGNQLSLSVMRWLVAAALVRPLEVTGHRDVLRMGHTIRYANRHQRRALTVRDGGCIFPGCTRTASRCDAHHVDEWNNGQPGSGGPTDIENLALLCRHHHRVTHRPGWHMDRWFDPTHPDAVVFRWRTPAGRVIYSQRHGERWQPHPGRTAHASG